MKPKASFEDATVSAAAAVDVAAMLKRNGIDPRPLFKQMKIDLKATEDPYQRVRLERYTHLLDLAADATQHPLLGLELGLQQDPAKWGAFGYVVLNSPTLGAAFNNMASYLKATQGATRIAFIKGKNRIGLEYSLLHPKVTHKDQDAEFAIAYFKNVVDRLSGRPVAPAAIHFEHNPKSTLSTYKQLLGITPEFDQSVNAVFYPASLQNQAVPSADLHLYPIIKHHLEDMIQSQPGGYDLVETVAYHIRQALPGRECKIDNVARILAMSGRTLQRHLKERGTSFAEILDNTRRDLGLQYIENPAMEIKEIAYLLGFTDASAFIKTFRRWTGTTPGEFRRQKLICPLKL